MKKIFKKNKNIIAFYINIIKANFKICFIAFLSMIIVTYLNTFLPKILQFILDDVIKKNSIKILVEISIIYLFINLIITLINIKKEELIFKIQKKTSNFYKIKMLKKLSKMSGRYYSNLKTGEMLNLIDVDCNIIESYGIDIWFSIINNILAAILSFYYLFKIEKKMLFLILIIQLIMILLQFIYTKKITNKTKEIRNDAGKVYDFIQEYITNIIQIIINKSKTFFFHNYIQKLRTLNKKEMQLNKIYVTNSELAKFFSGVISICIFAYGGYQIIKKKMTIGQLIAFEQYIWLFISPCVNLLRSNTNIKKMLVSLDRINDFLSDSDIIESKKNIKIENISTIKFDKVIFSYDKKIILNNINIELKNGQIYAFVGKTGCGKSTIINLLYRLWDAKDGNILINNLNIKDYNINSLRKNISIISQNMHIISTTIEDNLILGNVNITKDRYKEVCKILELDSFIENLPQGYKTIVGENGIKLSGGQKQRLVIGRILLQDSNILIFDEATSALDNITQNSIFKNINKYFDNKIVIIIAHRLSTVKNANIIYVMKDNYIYEYGSHEQLMINHDYYYDLVKEQD